MTTPYLYPYNESDFPNRVDKCRLRKEIEASISKDFIIQLYADNVDVLFLYESLTAGEVIILNDIVANHSGVECDHQADEEFSGNVRIGINVDVGGDISVDGLVDGRDIALDASNFEAHIADADIHREIDDGATGMNDLWSASKISTELSGKADTGHTHAAADTVSGTFADSRISESSVTQHTIAIESGLTHDNITGSGSNTHSQIDSHISDDTKHRTINDSGSSVTDLWSASKIGTELAGKSGVGHTHAAADVVSGTFADARISESSVTQHTTAIESGLTHDNITGSGSNTHAQIDSHISDDSKHRTINDSGSAVTDLWSASKIGSELAGKSETGHTHAAADVVSGTFADARISESSVTQHSVALEGTVRHNELVGFVSDEHVPHSSVSITAGVGLSGGGTIATTRTIDLDIDSLTANASPNGSMGYVAVWNDQTSEHEKVLVNDLVGTGEGEANTGSNVGTGGVGVYKGKSGTVFEFRNINAGSAKVTVSNDAVNDEIDIDIVPTEIDHNSLQNYSVDEHRTINDSGSAVTDLWSASKISTELAGKSGTGHTHAAADVVSGTFANARVSESSVTQHTAAIESGLSHDNITGSGSNTHAQIDYHISDDSKHRTINDSGSGTTDLWSASKIGTDLSGKSDVGHTHTAGDVVSGTFADARVSESSVTQHTAAIESGLSHDNITGSGSNTHAQIDSHISDVTKHRTINDAGSSTIDLWSASKINTELSGKSDVGHTHTSTDITDFNTAVDSRADDRISLQAGVANGLATLDGGGKVPASQLNLDSVDYQGVWNANTNTPDLAASSPTKGYYYVVSVAGSTNLDGITDWKVGDWAIYNGTVWEKADHTDQVTSVAGKQGAVVLDTGDITSGTFVDARISESSVTQHTGAIEGGLTHDNITGSGSNTHAQIDSHISDVTKHRTINDTGSSTTDLWSASKINTELSGKSEVGHTHAAGDVVSGTFADARISESSVTQHSVALEGTVRHDELVGFVSDEHIPHSSVSVTAGVGLSGGGTIAASRTINLDVNSLDADASPQGGADYVVTYDASAGTHKKVLLDNLPFSSTLNALDDTVITTPADNEVLAYNSGTSKWINQTPAEAGLATSSHTHSASDVVSGTFADARISESSVTQHTAAVEGGLNHDNISGSGTNTHAQIDSHIADASKHRSINDSGSSTTDLWSASKISSELSGKASSSHTHSTGDITSGVFPVARGGTGASSLTQDGILIGANTSAITALKSIWNASTSPTTTDDSGSGYAVGSRWINTTDDMEYVCLDASVGAAVWTTTTASTTEAGGWTDDGGTVRLTTSTDKVGIGISNPSKFFEVRRTNPGGGNHVQLIVSDDPITDDYNLGLDTGDSCHISMTCEDGAYRQATVFSSDGVQQNATIFGVASSMDSGTSWDPAFVVTQKSWVGIGKHTPTEALDVVGNIALSGTVDGRDVAADGSTLDAHVALSDEHVSHSSVSINAGVGLSGGGTIAATRIINLDINSLTADASPVGSTDYVVTYDASAGGHKKVLLDDLPGEDGDVTAASSLNSTAIVVGDDGAKGVKHASQWTISGAGAMSGIVSTVSDGTPLIMLRHNGASSRSFLEMKNAAGSDLFDFRMDTNQDPVFRVNDNGTYILTATSGGVGINKYTATAALDVVGSIALTGTVDGRNVSTDGSTLDTHVADASLHRTINDSGTSTTDLWSASKISSELSGKAASSHTHTKSDITDFTESDYVHTTGDETISGLKEFSDVTIGTPDDTPDNSLEIHTTSANDGIYIRTPDNVTSSRVFLDGVHGTGAQVMFGINPNFIGTTSNSNFSIRTFNTDRISIRNAGEIAIGGGIENGVDVKFYGTSIKWNDFGTGVLTTNGSGVMASGQLDASLIADGTVSDSEFQRLNGVTSDIQTQLDSKASSTHTHTKTDITDFTESDYVHTTGTETVNGTKTFTSTLTSHTVTSTDNLELKKSTSTTEWLVNAGRSGFYDNWLLFKNSAEAGNYTFAISNGGQFRGKDGSAGAPTYTFDNASNYGMSYDDGVNKGLMLSTEGIPRLRIEDDGTLSVAATTNYETLVTADDDIPNKKYVDDEIAAISGGGDVTAAASLDAEGLVVGDDGVKGVKTSTNWMLDSNSVLKCDLSYAGYILDLHNTLNTGGGNGFRIRAGEVLGDIAFTVEDENSTFPIMQLEADQGYITMGKTYAQTLYDNGTVYGFDIQHTGVAQDFNTQVGTYRIGGVSCVPPAGGTTGQVLEKIDGTDYNFQWASPASKVWLQSHSWGIAGEIKVASGDTDFLCPFFVKLESGQTAKLVSCRHRINGGTSATVKLQRNGGDITGFTGITVNTTASDTDPTDVTLANNDMLALVVTGVSGTPKNLSFTLFIQHTV